MANGNPRLLTHATDSTLRLYELTGSGAVLLNSAALTYSSSDVFCKLGFMHDGSVEAVLRGVGKACYIYTFMDLISKGSETFSASATGNPVSSSGVAANANAYLTSRTTGGQVGRQYIVSSAGALSYVASGTNLSYYAGYEASQVLSPDGLVYIRGRSSGVQSYAEFASTAGGSSFSGAVALPISATVTASKLRWSADSRFLFVVDSTNKVYVIERSGSTFSLVGELSSALGLPTAIAVSPNTRWVSVAYTDSSASAVTTVLYYRTAYTFAESQTLSGTFGALLDFTADSLTLIDAQNRRTYVLDGGTWIENTGLLSALPAGIVRQALSPHSNYPTGLGHVYNGVVTSILQGTVSLDSLKLALYDSSASFDNTATALPTAGEVYGSGWPQGGRPLSGVSLTSFSAAAGMLTASDVSQIIVDSALTFRSAIVYDSVSGNPLTFVDFIGDKTADVDSEMTIGFGPTGLLVFTP